MTRTAPLPNLNRGELNTINDEVDSKTSIDDIEEYIKEKRKDIFDILSNGRVDWNDDTDESLLEKINSTLDKKIKELNENLWEVSLWTSTFNFTSNNNSWVKYCDNIYAPKVGAHEKPNEARDCLNAIKELQNVYVDKKTETLFSGTKPSKSDILEKVINSTNASDLRNNIDNLIENVYSKDDNSISINKNSLYTQSQAEIADRIAIFLYCMKKALEEWRIGNPTVITEITNIITNLRNEQIPKIRWLYNIKKEKDAVEAMYNTLIVIRKNDITDIDWTDTSPNINLTDSFERNSTDKAKNINFYNLNKNKINVTINGTTYTDILLRNYLYS